MIAKLAKLSMPSKTAPRARMAYRRVAIHQKSKSSISRGATLPGGIFKFPNPTVDPLGSFLFESVRLPFCAREYFSPAQLVVLLYLNHLFA